MRYLYYTIQTLRRGRTSSFIKLLSLTLGLLVGVLLFAQIAYELNYEKCYPEPDRLVLARETFTDPNGVLRTTSSGHVYYDPTLFDVTAHTLEAEMPEWVESATVISDYGNQHVYKGDKLLEEASYVEADTAFFRTMGIEVLKGLPQELIQSDAIFLSQRFAKEIAIRKVNGASAGDILRLLSRGVLLIAVPCVAVGSVVAWYVGTEWLTQFAGQVSISPLHFVGLAVLLLVVIVCIVVVKAWRIANENPVKSIKSE